MRKTISITMDTGVFDAMDEVCKDTHRNHSHFIEMAVEHEIIKQSKEIINE